MIGRQAGNGAVDLLVVQRDNEVLDLLGARADLPHADEVVRLLSAWCEEIDDGLAALLPDLAAPAPVSPAATPVADGVAADDVSAPRSRRSRLTAAGTAVVVVLGGTLSLSGVAAAVTGDPLAPYRAVGKALSFGGDDLPDNAAQVAHFNKRLSRARAALAHGDVAGVQTLVDDLTTRLASADLTDQQRAALQHRLDSLRAAIARASADAARGRSAEHTSGVATPKPLDGADEAADQGSADQGSSDQGSADQGRGDQGEADQPTGAGEPEGATSQGDDSQNGSPDANGENGAKPGTDTGDGTADGSPSGARGAGTADEASGGAQTSTGETQTSTGPSGSAGGSGRSGSDQATGAADVTDVTVTGSANGKGSTARQ